MIFSPTTARCMRFWYNMNGNGIGTLRVNISYENGKNTTMWTLSGSKGDQWNLGQFGFNSSSMTYRLIITAIRGSSALGNIAIDDISFTDSACGILPLEVITELANIPTPAPITTTTRSPATITFNCNFDKNDTCGWEDDNTANFNWELNKGSTFSSDTGPTSGLIQLIQK